MYQPDRQEVTDTILSNLSSAGLIKSESTEHFRNILDGYPMNRLLITLIESHQALELALAIDRVERQAQALVIQVSRFSMN